MAEKAYEFVKYQVVDGVGEVVMNRPEKLNAFHLPMYEEICDALERAELDDAVRVILLRGEGRAFSAGRDFAFSAELQAEDGRDSWRQRYKLFTRWTLLNQKIVIALVQGYALGGGGSLAEGSDITIAATGTKFGYPETRHGPAAKTMIWSWAFGPKVAKEIVASGRTVTVDDAAHLGLINRVVPADELLAEGWNLAREIAGMPAGTSQIIKRRVNYASRDMLRTIHDDRKFDVDTAAWDAAGVVPSPWMQSAEEAFEQMLGAWGGRDDSE
jgi:enoyl-CoA hydratase/carnithine racemase